MPEKENKVHKLIDSQISNMQSCIEKENRNISGYLKTIEDYKAALEKARASIANYETELRDLQKVKDVIIREGIGQGSL